jgi:UDP-2,3-diacylglucosamine hydrolase
MCLKIQEGAILVSDAHYCKEYPLFFSFLQDINNQTIKTTQLILMGDMFELLFGVIKKTIKDNEQEIQLLQEISEKIEVIYFEGNHDFGLKNIFPDIEVYPLQKQPIIAEFKNQKIQLSHGDTKTPFFYQLYTKLIRNPFILSIIGFIDISCSFCIVNWLKDRGEKKDPCYKIDLFEEIIHKRLSYLRSNSLDTVIEGHFHQDLTFDLYGFEYINLASFACNQKYFIVQSNKEQFYLQENLYKESTRAIQTS